MHNLFLVGSGRSGSSVIAGMFARSGFAANRELHGRTMASPQGCFESLTVREINEALLAPITPAEQLLLDGQHWLARLDADTQVTASDEQREAIQSVLQEPFCLKDARFTWTLPTWRRHAPNSKVICTFRSPVATARSIVEACRLYPGIDRPAIDMEAAYELWIATHTRILDQAQTRDDWHFIHLDQTFSSESLEALQAFTGRELSRSFPTAERRAPACAHEAPKEARELYAELCDLAGYSVGEKLSPTVAARSVQQPEVAVVIPVREHQRSRVEQLLADIAAQRNVNAEVILVDQTTQGKLEAEGATVVREPSPSRGRAYRRALEVTRAPWIAWQDPEVNPFSHRLSRQLTFLNDNPKAQLCTSDLALRGENSELQRTLTIDLAASAPPGFWQSGVVVRREALENMDETCFVPTELSLYRRLLAAGEVVHLQEVLCSVPTAAFELRDAWERQNTELLRLASIPEQAEPTITVLLACHNRREALIECLEGFSRQVLPPGTLEIIVIDDGSRDGTPELVRDLRLPVAMRFLEQENAGAASARNRGMPHVRGQYVLFVNDDTIPFPDTVQKHVEALRELSDQRAIVLGTFEQPPEECEKNLTRVLEQTTLCFGYSAFDRDTDLGGSSFYTCNISLSTELVRAVGLFDEDFSMYAEDTEIGLRLEDYGCRTYFRPEARAIHRHILPFETIRKRQRVVSKAHVKLFKKHPRALAPVWQPLNIKEMNARLVSNKEVATSAERAAATLSDVNLRHVEAAGPKMAALSNKLEGCLTEVMTRLNGYWWQAGFVDALKELHFSGFRELLESKEETCVPDVPLVLLVAGPGDPTPWLGTAEAWISGVQPVLDGRCLAGAQLAIVAAPSGPSSDQLRSAVAGITARLVRRGQDARPVEVNGPLSGVPLGDAFSAAKAWIPTGAAADAEHEQLATEAGIPSLGFDLVGSTIIVHPWTIASCARTRFLAWPCWSSAQALRELILAMRPLVGREDTCVVLRHDPDTDGDLQVSLNLLQEVAQELHKNRGLLNVVVESSPASPEIWERLSLAVDGVLDVGGGSYRPEEWHAALNLPLLTDGPSLKAWLAINDAEAPDNIAHTERRGTIHA